MLKAVKGDFPIFNEHEGWIYLDTAATAQKPQPMIDRLSQFYSKEYATINRAAYSQSLRATEHYNETRDLVKELIHARSSDEIVFTKGTTESINLLAYCLSSEISLGDEILISIAEHHSNFVPWQLLCEAKGAKLVIVDVTDDGEIDFDDFVAKLSPRTKIVALAHISNVLGTIHPIKQLINLAHEQDALVIIDGAQALSHTLVDVQDLDVDFYAFSAHKLYGPNGLGVLYGKEHLLERLPPFQSGGDMVDAVTIQKTTFQKAPLKFEAGTPNIANVIAFGATLKWLKQFSLDAIVAHETRLTQKLIFGLKAFSRVKILGSSKNRAPIVSFFIDGIHPLDLATWLDLKKIAIRSGHLCAQPLLKRFKEMHVSRVSFGIYSTENDVEVLLKALEKAFTIF
jgi:cysteine desulfurase/selenocysteine lyase